MLMLLLACVDGLPGSCPDLTETPPVAACYGGPDVEGGDTGGGDATASWSGTIVEVGTGFPDECTIRFGGSTTASAWWVRLSTAEGDAWVGVDTAGSSAPAVGSAVTVAATYRAPSFGPTEASVELRKDGDLVAWVGASGTAEGLEAPETVSFTSGDPTCTTTGECGTWNALELRASVKGQEATIEEGASVELGGLLITNRTLRLASSSGSCLDWFVADALVGIGVPG